MPKWKRDDYRILYRFYQEHGMVLETRDLVSVGRAADASGSFWRTRLRAVS